jgi:DNA-binding XRE family transcriptional regulator
VGKSVRIPHPRAPACLPYYPRDYYYTTKEDMSMRDHETTHPLRELREAAGLAQAGLAVQAGCSPTTVLIIERWGHVPSAPVRQRLAAALGVDVLEIWPCEERPA